MKSKANNVVEPALVVERTYDAPVSKVWQALTNKEDIKQWSFDIKEFKPQVGFEFQFLAEKDGVKFDHRCKIIEVAKEKKLAYSWRYEGYEGNSLVTFEIFNEGNKTRLRLTHKGLETFPKNPNFAKKNFEEGWTMIIGKNLKEFVEKRVFIISRVFNAPRELVWKAFTEPERMKQWWGPKGCSVGHAKMDLRPGGEYHYSMRTPDSKEMWGKFVYREIVKPEKMVFVNSFSDEKGGLTRHPMNPSWPLEMLSTFTFREQDGKTTFSVEWSPLSPTESELKTFEEGTASMNQGWSGTLDQLNEYLESISEKK
jgi:uncharacterized protein YndB with AHSA1/START domain